MKSTLKSLLAFTLITLFVVSCGGDYRKRAQGQMGHVVVVMDSASWQSKTADAIRNTFGKEMETLPNLEPRYDLKFVDFSSREKLDQLKQMKNIIFAAPIDQKSDVGNFVRAILSDPIKERVRSGENFAFPLENKWYRDQWTLILTSTNDSTLAQKIENSGTSLVDNLDKVERRRWTEDIYERGEKVGIEDSLWDNHGWKIRVQHDYQLHIDTTNFVTLRRYMAKNDRWIWAWWKNDVTDISMVDKDWINHMRDSLMEKWVRGTRDSSYVTTEYRRPVKTRTYMMNGYYTYETRGTWRMTNDFMGGPFVNYTIYDEDTHRLFMVEFSQFAPKYDKRRFVRQFEAMGHTFRADSTYNAQSRPASD